MIISDFTQAFYDEKSMDENPNQNLFHNTLSENLNHNNKLNR